MNIQTIFLYFFSTLAQCAAAFAALAAVFAVFRLQSSSAAVEDVYRDSWDFIRRRFGVMSPLDVSFSKKRIKEQLRKSDDKEAMQWLGLINRLEQFPKTVAYKVSVPLKLWAVTFIISLVSLFCSGLSGCWFYAVVIVAVVEILLTVAALFKTKTFIQECLKTEANESYGEAA